MLSDSEVAAINAAIDVFMLDDREHLAARLRAIRVRLTASAQAPTRLLTEGQDEVGEIQARHEKAEAGRGPFTEDEGFDAHQNRATLLRILKSQVPQAPAVDREKLAEILWRADALGGVRREEWSDVSEDWKETKWRKLANAVLSSGLLHPATTWAEIYTCLCNNWGREEPTASGLATAIHALISGRVK